MATKKKASSKAVTKEKGTPKSKVVEIRGVHIKSTGAKAKAKEGATVFTIAMSGILNVDIRKVMDWDSPASGGSSGNLLGRLACTQMTFTPVGRDPFTVDINGARKFQWSREFDKEGGAKQAIRLDFEVLATSAGSIAIVDQFYAVNGQLDGALEIAYTMKAGKQDELFDGEKDEKKDESVQGAFEEV